MGEAKPVTQNVTSRASAARERRSRRSGLEEEGGVSARGDGKVPWRALTRLTGQIARANRVRAVRARMGVRHTKSERRAPLPDGSWRTTQQPVHAAAPRREVEEEPRAVAASNSFTAASSSTTTRSSSAAG